MKNDFRDYIYHSAEEELYHFGITGMKWGIRRYQNEDGSLTPLGAQHYGKKLAKMRNYTKSNLADYEAYSNKENAYELLGKSTKLTSKKKNKLKNKYEESKNKEDQFIKEFLNKKAIKKLDIIDNPDKYMVNKNMQKNQALGTFLAGPLFGTLPEAITRVANNKYYKDKKHGSGTISGQDMFVTLKDGRIIPINLNMYTGGSAAWNPNVGSRDSIRAATDEAIKELRRNQEIERRNKKRYSK